MLSIIMLPLLILLSGDVETNPGPSALSVLVDELHDLVNWESFAIHLPMIDQSDIEKICKQFHNVDNQKNQLYNVWIKKCKDASWDNVIAALEKSRQHTLADCVKKYEGSKIICKQAAHETRKDQGRSSKMIQANQGETDFPFSKIHFAIILLVIVTAVLAATSLVVKFPNDTVTTDTDTDTDNKKQFKSDEVATLTADEKILNAGESGDEVVEKCMEKLQMLVDLKVFPDDKNLMKRIAFVMSRNGDASFQLHNDGGIWQVSKYAFEDTKDEMSHVRLARKYQKIQDILGINWRKVHLIDLEKPMYSALAARLYLSNSAEPIPPSYKIDKQQEYWWRFYMRNHEAKKFMQESEYENSVRMMSMTKQKIPAAEKD